MAPLTLSIAVIVTLSAVVVADPLLDEVRHLQDVITILSKQLMLQQHFVEERIRTDGDSGVKQVRMTNKGTRSFMTDSYSGETAQAVHDHSETERTIGMGEIIAVLNGVEFRTRHNDYKLVMPSTKTTAYNALENVPFPGVPSSVTSKSNVHDQVAEMKEYFRAFKEQNSSIRHYENYFKPVLCYLEGAWHSDADYFTEPFPSDKHHVDATSWEDLQDKILYTSYTGHKSQHEDYSFLPQTIVDVHGNTPVFAQWNYRILCHPIKTKVGLQDLYEIDDLGVRIGHEMTMEELSLTPAARFAVAAEHGHSYNSTLMHGQEDPKSYTFGLLDRIMEEIPGKDNYPANIQDHFFGFNEYDMASVNESTLINDAYYHRTYKAKRTNSRGEQLVHNGFADQNLWIAQNSHPEISPLAFRTCHNGANHTRVCTTKNYHYSYAIPLEMIWLTPLHSWNPYHLQYHGGNPSSSSASVVTSNGRTGLRSSHSAYNGNNLAHFYRTPSEFYTGLKDSVGVLDTHGTVRDVVASGTGVFTPNINGVGKIRTRYPIAPTHFEGSVAWKELDALKEMAMNIDKYANYFETPISH